MASARMIARSRKLDKMSQHSQATRFALKKMIVDTSLSGRERIEGMLKLQKRSRDESRVRIVRRCGCCGRPRGVFRRFRLCRMCIRRFAALGWLPGLVKTN